MENVNAERLMSPPSTDATGGGLIVKDILGGLPAEACNPFLIWHELPRKQYRKGEMPGAPMGGRETRVFYSFF